MLPMYMRFTSLAIISVGLVFSSFSMASSVYVFIPTDMRTSLLQQDMQSLCPELDITVFGRAKDFHQQVQKVPPQGVLSLRPVVIQNDKFVPVLTGLKDNQITEKYLLVSVDKKQQLATLTDKKVGVIDLFGRKFMSQFVHDLLKTNVKLKRVTKVEDLLPLLSFSAVDALFISESTLERVKSRTKLNLVSQEVGVRLGLATTAIETDNSQPRIEACVNQFDDKLKIALGIDAWRTYL